MGKGVAKAVGFVNGEISAALKGVDSANQLDLDARLLNLDGTENKARLGANALLAVSLAAGKSSCAKSAAPALRAHQRVGWRRFDEHAGADDEIFSMVVLMLIIMWTFRVYDSARRHGVFS